MRLIWPVGAARAVHVTDSAGNTVVFDTAAWNTSSIELAARARVSRPTFPRFEATEGA